MEMFGVDLKVINDYMALRHPSKVGTCIAGFHCHAIKKIIENHSMNEVKKLMYYR